MPKVTKAMMANGEAWWADGFGDCFASIGDAEVSNAEKTAVDTMPTPDQMRNAEGYQDQIEANRRRLDDMEKAERTAAPDTPTLAEVKEVQRRIREDCPELWTEDERIVMAFRQLHDDFEQVTALVLNMRERFYALEKLVSAKATSPPADPDESPERLAEHDEQIRDDREDR